MLRNEVVVYVTPRRSIKLSNITQKSLFCTSATTCNRTDKVLRVPSNSNLAQNWQCVVRSIKFQLAMELTKPSMFRQIPIWNGNGKALYVPSNSNLEWNWQSAVRSAKFQLGRELTVCCTICQIPTWNRTDKVLYVPSNSNSQWNWQSALCSAKFQLGTELTKRCTFHQIPTWNGTQACGRSPAEIVGSNPTGGMDICLLWVSCVVR